MADAASVADQYYAALDRNDAGGAAGLLRDDTAVDVPGAVLAGPEQFKGWMQAFFDAFPDITHDHSDYAIDGDTVTTQLTVKGTHTAPLVSPEGTIPPTGRPIVIEATNVMVVDGNQISGLSISFDQAGFMRQLGLG